MNKFEKEMQYKKEVFAQKTPYLQWLRQQEAELHRQYADKVRDRGATSLGKQVYTLPFSSCTDKVADIQAVSRDGICLFVKTGGSLSEYAKIMMCEAFMQNADAVLVYADEDYRGSLKAIYGIEENIENNGMGENAALKSNYRGAPWFKPDFSPDTLASFFYIGSVFAVRGDAIADTVKAYEEEHGEKMSIYELVYQLFMKALAGDRDSIIHIPRVLYTNDSLAESDRIIRFNSLDNGSPVRESELPEHMVSIIIPSKDNAAVLKKCLETLTKYTAYNNYEIIIVDNGSSSEQKMCITGVIETLCSEQKEHNIRYLYKKMDFNFSTMCNMGAAAASGAYLLFLNDDIEVMDTAKGAEWLAYMVRYVKKKHVGAVGAKLYYPKENDDNERYRIQHAGITNMGIGPAHKLGGLADCGCLYHGHNTENYDMLAVTAACMLVKRSLFDAVGGFDTTFPVAYNDVAFCFALYEKGYFNVQVNDAVLIHHESLSRGQDTTTEKMERLDKEKRRLYEKYPNLKAKDPFYSPNLVQWKKDVKYNTGYLYECDKIVEPVMFENSGEDGKRKRVVLKRYGFREMLKEKSGLVVKIYDRMTGYHDFMLNIDSITYDISTIAIQGWFAVGNADNADIPKKLWLISEVRDSDSEIVYEFAIEPKLREDVAALYVDDGRTKNTALSGIQIIFQKGAIKPGSYCIGVVCKDRLICDYDTFLIAPNADIVYTGISG